MNDLTAAALARADAEESTLYFVVPLIGPADNVIPCAYFNARWERIPSPKPLDTVNTNAIMFAQQSVGLSPDVLVQLGNSKPDTSVTLFVAVAKTLEKPSGLPNTFVATGLDQATTVTLPVGPGTRRGVVLVFRRPASGNAQTLIATSDPEIRNGSSSDD